MIAVDDDDNYYIGGIFDDYMGIGQYNLHASYTYAYFAAKFNSSGTCSWAIQGGGVQHDDDVYEVSSDNQGNAYLSYLDGAVSAGPTVHRLSKISNSGSIMWTLSLSGQNYSVLASSSDEVGNYIVTGGFGGTVSFGTITLTSADGWDML